VEDFRKGISTNIYGGTMPKTYISFFKILKSQNFENSKKIGPPFLGSFFEILLWLGA
jgi:hypothetical protein